MALVPRHGIRAMIALVVIGASTALVACGGSDASSEDDQDKADNWGMRKMAYEIRQRNEADYRYYRFQGENDLLERLDHNLKIADGVLRFRIFKVDPGTTTNAPPASERPAAVGDGRGDRGDRERRPRRDDRDE